MDKYVALIGLGVVGAPLANLLYKKYGDDFALLSSKDFLDTLTSNPLYMNGELFSPRIFSNKKQLDKPIGIVFICVKNYHIKFTADFLKTIIDENTIILPLQNGKYSYDFFKKQFPKNVVLEGFAQGPNTQIFGGSSFVYQKPGMFHIGSSDEKYKIIAQSVCSLMKDASITCFYDDNIKYQVWKKMMLNVAGNAVTALTGIDYCLLKESYEAQHLCREAMLEFIQVAKTQNIILTELDIDEIFDYFFSFTISKKTSMLDDVTNNRPTENNYLAGYIVKLAKDNGISTPYIDSLYNLIKVKEDVYLNNFRKANLFPREENLYSPQLRDSLIDIDKKLKSLEYAKLVNAGALPELTSILNYAILNTDFYSNIALNSKLTSFPVMNKTTLNQNYDSILVHSYDDKKVHKMHTSGSTGIPFTVVQNLEKRERHIADLKYYGMLGGFIDGEPMCYLRAKPTATISDQERDNIWQLDICNLNSKNLTDYYHIMCQKKCVALIAYPSTLKIAADFWNKHFHNESSIKTIFTTSESLTDEVRNSLRDFFGDNVSIFARYSNTEQGVLGQEFVGGNANEYALNWASYYFELLKFDSDEPVSDGELGRIVVTDLYNKAFPLIRYDTGDVAIMRRKDDSHLPYFVCLYGRRMDLIYDCKGEVVSPFLLCRTMRLAKGIQQWQFIQENRNSFTIKVLPEPNITIDLSKEIQQYQEILGSNALIKIEIVDDLPVLSSLKRKLIVSHYKK